MTQNLLRYGYDRRIGSANEEMAEDANVEEILVVVVAIAILASISLLCVVAFSIGSLNVWVFVGEIRYERLHGKD